MRNLRKTLATVKPDTICYVCGHRADDGAYGASEGVVCVAMMHDAHTISAFRDGYIRRLPKVERVRITGVPGAGILDAFRRYKFVRANPSNNARRRDIRIITDDEIRGLPTGDEILGLSYEDLHRLLTKTCQAYAQLRRRPVQGIRTGPAAARLAKIILKATVEWQLRKAAAHTQRMSGKKGLRRGALEEVMRERARWYRSPGSPPEGLGRTDPVPEEN